MEFYLTPSDPAALNILTRAIITPGSASYRHFLTHAQFVARFGASSTEVSQMTAWLASTGATAITLDADHLAIHATATVAQVERALSTSIDAVAVGSRQYIANVTPAVAPARVAGLISSVAGLDTLPQAQTQVRIVRAASIGVRNPKACSTLNIQHNATTGPYTTTDLVHAYKYTGELSGAGVSVGLFELSTADQANETAYDRCYGVRDNTRVYNVDGGASDANGQVEVLLDEEIISSIAPRAHIDLYEGPNTMEGYFDTLRAIANANRDKVVSMSWGMCESLMTPGDLTTENTIFQEMAAQGQSVLVASGDSGAQGCMNATGDMSAQASDPGSQPYVTSVGGTSLFDANCQSASPSCEVVWHSSNGAGSGGFSSYWPAPSYQAGLGFTARAFPDIAADADPTTGYLIYDADDFMSFPSENPWGVIGGTSAAAPLEAAFLADTEVSCPAGVGLLNPILYALNGTSALRDITIGSNDMTHSNYTLYNAHTGFDEASGLGSPIWDALAPHICSGK
jgi:subtilase family serine protease